MSCLVFAPMRTTVALYGKISGVELAGFLQYLVHDLKSLNVSVPET